MFLLQVDVLKMTILLKIQLQKNVLLKMWSRRYRVDASCNDRPFTVDFDLVGNNFKIYYYKHLVYS